MSLDPALQSRFGNTKVRTGCLACKSRHLKCDERKPKCDRCLKSGRICRPPSLNTKEPLRIVRYVPPVSRPPAQFPAFDTREQQSLHFFRTRTATELAGVYCPEIWLRYGVHIAMFESAIRHAIVALAALHQQFEQGHTATLTDVDARYPLAQYTKAITLLTKSMTDQSWSFPDTPLLACMLFCAFESMSYRLDSAIAHVSSGLRIWAERETRTLPANAHRIPEDMLRVLYARLDIQRMELGESCFTPCLSLVSGQDIGPAAFQSIDTAQWGFDDVVAAILRTVRDRANKRTSDSIIVRSLRALTESYSVWSKNFVEFILNGVGDNCIAACILLHLRRIVLNINLRVDLRNGEMDFDNFTREFEYVVELAREFIILQQPSMQLAESKGTPETIKSLTRDINSERHAVHCGEFPPEALNGGFLGVQPDETPLVPDLALECKYLTETTQGLLLQARSMHRLAIDSTTLKKSGMHSRGPPSQAASFSFSPGVVSPLYVVMTRCRDPTIRRESLLLLRTCKRREGLWDSALAATLGEKIIKIEEGHVCVLHNGITDPSTKSENGRIVTSAGQIPNHARVRMVKPTFLPDRRCIERYYLGWSGSLEDARLAGETWIEEILQW